MADAVMSNDDGLMQIIQNDILALMGLDTMPKEEQDKLREEIIDIANNRIAVHVLDSLDDNDARAWQKLLAEGNYPAGDAFLKERGIDINEISMQETLALKVQLLAQANAVFDEIVDKDNVGDSSQEHQSAPTNSPPHAWYNVQK